MSSDETGRVRGKEYGGADKLFEFTEARGGCAHQKFLAARCAIEQRRIEGGTENSGHQAIHANAMARPLDG